MRPSSDTLLVWTGGRCISGCAACPIDPAGAPTGVTVPQLQQALAGVSARAGRLVVLVGGEPFLRPDILQLVAIIRAAGCAPGIVTTGRPLVYAHLRERLRRAGLAYLRMQLFGTGAAHDRATAVHGAFEQAVTGLRAWVDEAGTECDVDVALTLRRRPIDSLISEVEELAGAIASPHVQLVVALDRNGDLAPHDTQILQRAVETLTGWNDDAGRPLLAWEGLASSIATAAALTSKPPDPAFVGTIAPVASCLGRTDAAARDPLAERATCANSFNFVRTATEVTWTASPEACTAYRAARDVEPGRSLWLVEGEQLALCVTDTHDFGHAEIARVKDEWSHLFLDRAPAGVLDDIEHGMRRLVPEPTCEVCAERPRCGRRYRVVEGAPFAREEAWISGHVARLRGHVLDVGCGEQVYRDALCPLVRSGAVQYTGLDPDEPSLDRLRSALPEGAYHVGGIEDFHGEPASYDHILCLRSLNHVVDLDEGFARMAALLKPGGSLLIVECTPFAMVRRPEQVAAADRAPHAGHQHFRNVASDEVLPFARRRSLRVVEHQAAGRQSTNEWILLLERPR